MLVLLLLLRQHSCGCSGARHAWRLAAGILPFLLQTPTARPSLFWFFRVAWSLFCMSSFFCTHFACLLDRDERQASTRRLGASVDRCSWRQNRFRVVVGYYYSTSLRPVCGCGGVLGCCLRSEPVLARSRGGGGGGGGDAVRGGSRAAASDACKRSTSARWASFLLLT